MPAAEVFLPGVIETAARAAGIHPEDWDKSVFKYKIMAKSPIMATIKKGGTTNSRFKNWAEEPFQRMRGTVLDVYTTNPILASPTAYVSGGVSGTTLFLTMTADAAKQFMVGSSIIVMDNASTGTTVYQQVTLTVTDIAVGTDTTSYLVCKLQQADTNAILASGTLLFTVGGSAYAEGSGLPNDTGRDLVWYRNRTQIMMGSYAITGTELAEESRIGESVDAFQSRLAMDRFLMNGEQSILFGREGTTYDAATGKEIRRMRGMLEAFELYEPTHIFNFATDTHSKINGKTWLVGGWDYFKHIMDETTMYDTGSPIKQFYCGTPGWRALTDIAEDRGMYNVSSETTEFGLRITRIKGLQKDLEIISHARFNENPMFQNQGFLTEPGLNTLVPMVGRDITMIKSNGLNQDAHDWVDEKKEGMFMEATLKHTGLAAQGWIRGLGMDNRN